MSSDVDVLIAGYGPVGQVLAAILGRQGHSVTVCEKHLRLWSQPRAGHFDHEVMRIFQSLRPPIDARAVATPARTYAFLDAAGSVLAELPRRWQAPSAWDASYHFYQPELEAALDYAARSQPSVSVLHGMTLEHLQHDDDGVAATLRDVSGETSVIRADYVVGADGANSTVRGLESIAWEDLGFRADWLVVDVRLNDETPAPDIPDTAQICDPARPGHMAWLRGPYFRWEFMLVDDDDAEAIASDTAVWQLLERWLGPGDATIVRRTVYTFRSGIAQRYRRGRVILAGDAAHLMPPFLGQGMCSGIRDAATLAWMLDYVVRGVTGPELLDNYFASRAPHVRAYIEESVRVGRIVCETDPGQAARNAAELSSGTRDPQPFQPRIGGLYRASDPLAGCLAVQPVVRGHDGSETRLDDIIGSGFQLLATEPLDDLRSLLAAPMMASLGVQVVTVSEARDSGQGDGTVSEIGSTFRDWMRSAGVKAVVVRPDYYVYGSAKELTEIPALLDSLMSDLGIADRATDEKQPRPVLRHVQHLA